MLIDESESTVAELQQNLKHIAAPLPPHDAWLSSEMIRQVGSQVMQNNNTLFFK